MNLAICFVCFLQFVHFFRQKTRCTEKKKKKKEKKNTKKPYMLHIRSWCVCKVQLRVDNMQACMFQHNQKQKKNKNRLKENNTGSGQQLHTETSM